jgi:hypothetical protein
MNWLASTILLQNEHTRPFCVLGVFLDNQRSRQTIYGIANRYVVSF